MDSLPNEILPSNDLPARECAQNSGCFIFATDTDIANFMTIYQNKVVPSDDFSFSEDLLAYGQQLEPFCVQFGKLVKCLKVFDCNPSRLVGGNSVSKNVHILMKNCVNVEEIDYLLVKEVIGKFANIPALQNLKTMTIKALEVKNKDVLPVVNQIFQEAPNLRNVLIKKLGFLDSGLAILADMLNQLHNMKETVRIQELLMHIQLPVQNVIYLENLAANSTPFRIDHLRLRIFVRDRNTEELVLQQVELLSKWIQNLTSIRKLSLQHCTWRNGLQITMPLHFLGNLQCLDLWNILVCIPVVPGQEAEFPTLTSLICMNEEDIHKFSFSGCVFPNVKFAQIELKTEEECEEWPCVLPNVEDLWVWSETLKGVFRFPKLRKLRISIFKSNDDGEFRSQQWSHLTGGAEYVSDGSICSFPVKTPTKSDSIDSLGNLPLLTHLTFIGEGIECWKGIIYASRTGQLGRLQQLTLSRKNFHAQLTEIYRTELMKYHDSVE